MGSGSSKSKAPTATTVEIKIKDPVPEETEAEESEAEPMPPIKLTYFDSKGRCEYLRLLLAASGLEFEDNRLASAGSQEWADMKPSTPFGHLPVLDFGDARIAQSPCILRFVAKIGGMDAADDSNTAAAMVDMTADATIDFLLSTIRMASSGSTEEEVSAHLHSFLGQMESQLGKTDSTFVAGEKMTYADVVLFDVFGRMADPDDPIFSKFETVGRDVYPKLTAMNDAVAENEGIKKYLESRPKKAAEEESAEEDGRPAAEGEGDAGGEGGEQEAPVDDSNGEDAADGGGGGEEPAAAGDEAPAAPADTDDKGEEVTAEGA